MKRAIVVSTVLALVSAAAVPAAAERTIELVPTCVAVDAVRDELAPAMRPGARMLLVRTLERLDQLIVDSDCVETVTLTHDRDGQDVIVRIERSRSGREGSVGREVRVAMREDMRSTYQHLARALLADLPRTPSPAASLPAPRAGVEAHGNAHANGTVDATIDAHGNVPRIEPVSGVTSAAPEHVTRSFWHVRLGTVLQLGSGVAFTGGWRREWMHGAVDLGVTFASTESVRSSTLRAHFVRYHSPAARSSGYYGLGVALSSVVPSVGDQMSVSERESEGGVGLELVAGLELARQRANRWLLEASLSLPGYTVGDRYPAALVTSVGCAW